MMLADRPFRRSVLTLLLAAAAGPALGQAVEAPPAGARLSALDEVRADSLRGHLSFLASDLLEGRDTPSRGLDLAAEYIAAQFRRAGLEPVGDDGYFQTARWEVERPEDGSFRLTFRVGDRAYPVALGAATVERPAPMQLDGLKLFKVDARDPARLDDLPAEAIEGRAVLVRFPGAEEADMAARQRAMQARRGALAKVAGWKPALILEIEPGTPVGAGFGPGRLIDPETPAVRAGLRLAPAGPAQVVVHDPEAVAALDALPDGPTEAVVDYAVGEPVRRPAVVKNVVGLLRGSDPALDDEVVIVSAHYDHIGFGAPAGPDRIYNGANDDASGTAAVVELAGSLARLDQRPRRSILFMTFFGEEKGLLGSRYYGRHPIFPLEKTAAHVNLEQVGRTDDLEGPRVGALSMTGFDFSEVGPILAEAAEAVGIAVERHPRNSDAFFGRSDNQALADLGVPAHTLCTAFMFPDYHGPLDHWEKVDFENMERVTRAVGAGLLALADREERPRWNAENPKAAKYARAAEALNAAGGR